MYFLFDSQNTENTLEVLILKTNPSFLSTKPLDSCKLIYFRLSFHSKTPWSLVVLSFSTNQLHTSYIL